MISRNLVESILRINGVSPTSSNEEIKSVLLSARYNDDEIDSAIMVLREDVKKNTSRVDGLHKIFRTDQKLKSNEISNLLGVEVNITDTIVRGGKPRKILGYQFIAVIFSSFALAIFGVILYMFFHKVGMFYGT